MPIKNPKAKGSRNERKSIEFLEKLGYNCFKSAGSLGAFDVIGIGKFQSVLVQVKSNRMPNPAERAKLLAFQCPPFMIKEIHVWKDYAKEPEVHYVEPHVEKELVEDKQDEQ